MDGEKPEILHLRRTKSWGRMVNTRIPAAKQLIRLSPANTLSDFENKCFQTDSDDGKRPFGMLSDVVCVHHTRPADSSKKPLKPSSFRSIVEDPQGSFRFVLSGLTKTKQTTKNCTPTASLWPYVSFAIFFFTYILNVLIFPNAEH